MDSTREWSIRDVDLDRNANDILDKLQNQWWSTATCRSPKDTDNNTETKTERVVVNGVVSRLVTKESNEETKKKPGWPREMLLDWLTKKDYNMDYSQLKRMTEDKTECRR